MSQGSNKRGVEKRGKGGQGDRKEKMGGLREKGGIQE